jgi:ABC-2 type transport system permease protein
MMLQYRAAALAGFATQLFWGLIRIMIFRAFYLSSSAPPPMALPDLVTYVWLSQAFLGLLPWSMDRDIEALVRSGGLGYELARPVDVYAFWYARNMASRMAAASLRSLPILVIAGLFLGLRPPAGPAASLAWLAAMVGSILLGSAIATVMSFTLLWTISGDGIARLVPPAVTLLSGMIVPLPFFPAWAQPILSALPFRGLVDTPFRLYSGDIPALGAIPHLAHQIAWVVILVLLGRLVVGRGLRRAEIQGG